MDILNVCSPSFDEADSYGIIGAQLVKHLSAKGLHVNPFSLCPTEHGVQSAELKSLLAKPIRACFSSIILGYPTNVAKFPAIAQHGRQVAVTMFESTILPRGWREVLNTMQAVITPSTFCKQVFRDSGVTAPIHVVPLGVSCTYRPAQRPTDRPLTFLAFLDRGERKGGLVALQAFLAAFGSDTNYRLILKGRKPKVAMEITNPNIEVIQRDMSEAELNELYLSADILIDANKGEGFGMIGRQFAGTSGISLSTAFSGTLDDLEHWGNPIPCKLVPANWAGNATLEGQDLGYWAEVDPAILAHQLRRVANNRTYYQARAKRAAAYVAQRYTWAGFAEKVLRIWRGET